MAGSGPWRRGQAYSQYLRDRVLAAPDLTARQAAARFDVSPSCVVKARARLRDAGERAAQAQCNYAPSRLRRHEQALGERVGAAPDAILDELQDLACGGAGGVRGPHRVLERAGPHGVALKKSTSGPPNRIALTSPSPVGLGRAPAQPGPEPDRVHRRNQGEHASQAAAIRSTARKSGCSGETLRTWLRQAGRYQARRAGPTAG